jgi:hypothetical protein
LLYGLIGRKSQEPGEHFEFDERGNSRQMGAPFFTGYEEGPIQMQRNNKKDTDDTINDAELLEGIGEK